MTDKQHTPYWYEFSFFKDGIKELPHYKVMHGSNEIADFISGEEKAGYIAKACNEHQQLTDDLNTSATALSKALWKAKDLQSQLSIAERLKEQAEQTAEAANDILLDYTGVIDEIADLLNIPAEPHQHRHEMIVSAVSAMKEREDKVKETAFKAAIQMMAEDLLRASNEGFPKNADELWHSYNSNKRKHQTPPCPLPRYDVLDAPDPTMWTDCYIDLSAVEQCGPAYSDGEKWVFVEKKYMKEREARLILMVETFAEKFGEEAVDDVIGLSEVRALKSMEEQGK